jgi:hypothetical protein
MAQEGVKLSDLKDNLLPLIMGLQSLLKRAIPIEEYLRVAMYETTTYSAARSFAAVRNLLNFFGIQLDDVILPEKATTPWRLRSMWLPARLGTEYEPERLTDYLPICWAWGGGPHPTAWRKQDHPLSERRKALPKPYFRIQDTARQHL